jgi:hypothetical protein
VSTTVLRPRVAFGKSLLRGSTAKLHRACPAPSGPRCRPVSC